MLNWMKTDLSSSTAVVMWWDYGNWLADLGNVTSLADNTTVNATQIQNVGFIFMGNENQSMAMLNSYGQNRVKYIGVFEVLYVQQTSTGYYASPAGYGDEGKWTWMASISGEGMDRLVKEGYISAADKWTDQSAFGTADQNTGRWVWNDRGLNCTVFELMNYAEVQYCNTMSAALSQSGQTITITPDQTTTVPTYFKQAYIGGLNITPTQFGGLVPLVAIYEIDWAAYDAAHGITPPS
jgi:asparagine N-glycosylation enzyme membrane subunit Stt3